jgi:hypothetical protein
MLPRASSVLSQCVTLVYLTHSVTVWPAHSLPRVQCVTLLCSCHSLNTCGAWLLTRSRFLTRSLTHSLTHSRSRSRSRMHACTRTRRSRRLVAKGDELSLPAGDVRLLFEMSRPCLRPFSDVAGYDGMFVCSTKPHFLMMGPRKELRQHPLSRDWGAVSAFAGFDSVHCPRGFVALHGDGEMCIASLPGHVNYGDSMLTQKTPLKKSVTHIAFHEETGLYAIVSYVRVPADHLPAFRNEEIGEPAPMDDPRYVPTHARVLIHSLTHTLTHSLAHSHVSFPTRLNTRLL